MIKNSGSIIRKEKRQSLFLKEIAQLIRELSQEEPLLLKIYPTRVEFSPGEGVCLVYLAGINGKQSFDEALEILKLYRASIRTILAKTRQARYVPEIKFLYDEAIDKSHRIDELLSQVQVELKKTS